MNQPLRIVEIVVTAFYVTDLSVGTHAPSQRWF
jgi:hypothetical protein